METKLQLSKNVTINKADTGRNGFQVFPQGKPRALGRFAPLEVL